MAPWAVVGLVGVGVGVVNYKLVRASLAWSAAFGAAVPLSYALNSVLSVRRREPPALDVGKELGKRLSGAIRQTGQVVGCHLLNDADLANEKAVFAQIYPNGRRDKAVGITVSDLVSADFERIIHWEVELFDKDVCQVAQERLDTYKKGCADLSGLEVHISDGTADARITLSGKPFLSLSKTQLRELSPEGFKQLIEDRLALREKPARVDRFLTSLPLHCDHVAIKTCQRRIVEATTIVLGMAAGFGLLAVASAKERFWMGPWLSVVAPTLIHAEWRLWKDGLLCGTKDRYDQEWTPPELEGDYLSTGGYYSRCTLRGFALAGLLSQIRPLLSSAALVSKALPALSLAVGVGDLIYWQRLATPGPYLQITGYHSTGGIKSIEINRS